MVSTIGSGFEVRIVIEKLLVLGNFSPWGDFLSLGHCLAKSYTE
jgi:hypothetical protein